METDSKGREVITIRIAKLGGKTYLLEEDVLKYANLEVLEDSDPDEKQGKAKIKLKSKDDEESNKDKEMD